MDDILVPIVFFAIIPVTIWLVLKYRTAAHSKTTDTLTALINKDVDITPDLIRALDVRPVKRHRDLRIGLFLIAISLASIFFGGLIPEEEAHDVFLGLASFPFLVGLVYLGLWALITRKDEAA